MSDTSCPVCNDKRVVYHMDMNRLDPIADARPCPRCRPDAPGRLLKSAQGESLEGEALSRAILET